MKKHPPDGGGAPLPKTKHKKQQDLAQVVRPAKPIPSNDYGVEIGGRMTFAEMLNCRIKEAIIVVRRERLSDGTERITYRNCMP